MENGSKPDEFMNPIQLFHADGQPAKDTHYCGECRIIHATKHLAEQCCVPPKCEDCGEPAAQYYTVCDSCREKRAAERERERFEKAEKVTEWDGPVYLEGLGGDDYVANAADIEELLYNYGDDDRPRPEYVWTCHSVSFAQVDLNAVIENIAENSYDDWDESDLEGTEELGKAIGAFNEKNKGIVSWEPNYKKALLLQPLLKPL